MAKNIVKPLCNTTLGVLECLLWPDLQLPPQRIYFHAFTLDPNAQRSPNAAHAQHTASQPQLQPNFHATTSAQRIHLQHPPRLQVNCDASKPRESHGPTVRRNDRLIALASMCLVSSANMFSLHTKLATRLLNGYSPCSTHTLPGEASRTSRPPRT